MAKGIVDLVDRDYSLVRRDARFGIKPLRTRPSSFTFMSDLWSNWRREYLKRKLEKQKEALLQEQFEANVNGALSDSSLKKMEEKTEAIAELEKRIKFLSKEVVPRNFVAAHAIKLRRNMFDHLTFNGINAYSVGLDKYDEVFENTQESEIAPEVDASMPSSIEDAMASVDSGVSAVDESSVTTPVEESESVVDAPAPVGREDMDSSIEEEFDAMDSKVQNISPQDVEMAVRGENRFENGDQGLDDSLSDEAIASIEAGLSDISVIPAVEDQDDSKDVISDENNPVSIEPEVPENGVTPVSEEEIFAVPSVPVEESVPTESEISDILSVPVSDSVDYSNVDAGLDNISMEVTEPSVDEVSHNLQDDIVSIASSEDESTDGIRVSQNGSSVAKINHYDDEGELTYREWQPLSDEEIEAAQRDLAEHPVTGTVSNDSVEIPVENTASVDTEDAIRDFVVVAPDRDVHSVDELVNNPTVEENPSVEETPISSVEVSETSEDNSVEQVMNSFANATTLEEFMSLKEAVEELQRKQKETNQEREEAERRAKEREEQARESERIAHEKQALLSERMARLNEYREALLEDCTFNENKTRSALSSVEASERIIAEQENSVREADDVIAGIDSLIGPQAVDVTVKGR